MLGKKSKKESENMDMPRIIYEKPKKDYTDRVDKIFAKFGDIPDDLLKLRKEQLLNHSNCGYICDMMEALFDMLGRRDNEANRLEIEVYTNTLVELHTPLYLDVPVWPIYTIGPEAWEEWDVHRIILEYLLLVDEKGWQDFYDFNQITEIKNYHVLDMLNDLHWNGKIFQYHPEAFGPKNRSLLDDFNMETEIPVKVKQ